MFPFFPIKSQFGKYKIFTSKLQRCVSGNHPRTELIWSGEGKSGISTKLILG